jgi:hypothetical protein
MADSRPGTCASFQMSQATPQMRRFAQRLIAYEARLANRSSEAAGQAIFHVIDKLRPQLVNLMGNAGFRALLSRALALANEEVRWLRAMHVKADGALEGLNELHTQVDPVEYIEGKVVLLAQLLGLLVALIGPGLTSSLVGEIWPKIPLRDLDFVTGETNEQTE